MQAVNVKNPKGLSTSVVCVPYFAAGRRNIASCIDLWLTWTVMHRSRNKRALDGGSFFFSMSVTNNKKLGGGKGEKSKKLLVSK